MSDPKQVINQSINKNMLTALICGLSGQKKFQNFLATLGYPHWDETKNPAYRLFLK